jgi:hypothetical protein
MPQMEGLGISFMSKNRQQIMQSKIVLSALLAILVVGISQFAFAEEPEKTTHIAVDEEKFQQPSSKYNYHEIVFLGFVEDYSRGEQVTITIISPDESENEINTYASKKGEIYTIIHITNESQIGIHQVILQYQDVEIASATFEILENS